MRDRRGVLSEGRLPSRKRSLQGYEVCRCRVDAKPEAITFYQRYGLIEFFGLSGHLGDRPQPRPMFLEIDPILGSPPNP